jgi:hypothetical protein
LDKLAEAYHRMEFDVDVSEITSFEELEAQFLEYRGITKGSQYWPPTYYQSESLRALWRGTLRGMRARIRRGERAFERVPRRFSKSYESVQDWRSQPHRTRYERRILSYVRRHPYATLQGARGHLRR